VLNRVLQLVIVISIASLTYSCEDYCDFEFSEEYFPLEIGNTWEYWDLVSRGSYNKWEIIDSIDESGIDKYIVEWTDWDGDILGEYKIYFIKDKLYTNMPLSWYYKSDKSVEYVLVDFSTREGDIFEMEFGEGMIISKTHNSIKVGIIPSNREYDYWDFEMTFKKGKGITEMWDWNWHIDKLQLIDYRVN